MLVVERLPALETLDGRASGAELVLRCCDLCRGQKEKKGGRCSSLLFAAGISDEGRAVAEEKGRKLHLLLMRIAQGMQGNDTNV